MSFFWSSNKPPAPPAPASNGWQLPHHFLEQLRATSPTTKLCLCLLAAIVLVLFISYIYYGSWINNKYLELDKKLEEKEIKMQCKEMTLGLVTKQLFIAKEEEQSMHNALYMSEARHKAKTRRRSRPKRVGSRSPELLSNITAKRCKMDGIAVLEITDDEDERRSEISWRSRRSRRDEKSPTLGSEREADRPSSPENESVTFSRTSSPGREAESMRENDSFDSCFGTIPLNPAVTHL